ncbi:class I adenylate-forming enzyme family protein [Nocardia camponoti]|uniref:AMP-binding protein n=1 Tax=Nocardia camponoti TaxID=1616106 RepID=A0A917V753_9NOCA|nr:class I adenylate-forming enzyme family protein [Nocardia camponoti]GGK45649.1 AMP-binding protein [Nocardia camponoti]
MTDPRVFIAQVAAGLTAPGAPFEQVSEPVLGVSIPVMAKRYKSLPELLTASEQWGERDYLVTEDRRVSFVEHAAAARAVASVLADRYGVKQGDRVGIFAANGPDWVIAFWATQLLGAVAVGYNAWWAPPEIAYGVEHTSPVVVFADAKRGAVLAKSGVAVPTVSFENDLPAMITDATTAVLPAVSIAEDDPAVILYSSGTSGKPKGVTASHRNLIAVSDYHRFTDAMMAAFTGQTIDGPSERRYLVTAPLFHIASLHNLVIPRLATGATVVFAPGAFDAERVLRVIAKERVTNWAAVPTMAARLLALDLTSFDLSSLGALSLNSAPSSERLLQEVAAGLAGTGAQVALTTSYGLTESGTAATVATPLDLAADPTSVGGPIIGVAVEIRDADGRVVDDGEEGEVCIRSPYVMLGYWADEAATKAAIDNERWLRTGDFGTLADGRLRLSGRRSDLILRGGENVYPVEVEHALDAHPAVIESAVIGVDHPDLGQEVAAIVVVADEPVDEAALRDFLADRIAAFKIPSRWRISQESLPRNATGKVTRRSLAL